MRKPRDFDSELKALAKKAKQLKERRVRELGALVTACLLYTSPSPRD